jgi:acetylornithine deacetylase/succinyl-diaminopimelate desuccinylase-like protein
VRQADSCLYTDERQLNEFEPGAVFRSFTMRNEQEPNIAPRLEREVSTIQLPLSDEQERWYSKACAQLDSERLTRILLQLIDIPSPTGGERQVSTFIADYLRQRLGGRARYQPINEDTGNAVGEIRGLGGGATLLLYAPVDTHLEGDPDKDLPWAGPVMRADMVPKGYAEGDLVFGLGAANPKCMVATLCEIGVALFEAKIPLSGDLTLGFAGGGMPVSVAARRNYGMSDGLYHLLTRGVAPDFAIIMKPVWRVYAEEPGMCWFKVAVRGTLGYAGIPRGTPGYRDSIVTAAEIIKQIDAWLPEYTKRNTAGEIAPEGHIGAIRGGWPERPAFPSAVTEIFVDIRCNPRTAPAEVKAQFAQAMEMIHARNPGIDFDWEMFGAYPGGATDVSNWIIQSTRRGWERVQGRAHGEPPKLSGQTDGALIRRLGIPCARIGFPWPPRNCPAEFKEGLGGMGVASIPDLIRSARAIIYAVIDTLTRPRHELGL